MMNFYFQNGNVLLKKRALMTRGKYAANLVKYMSDSDAVIILRDENAVVGFIFITTTDTASIDSLNDAGVLLAKELSNLLSLKESLFAVENSR